MANRADQRKFHYIYKITRTDGSGKYYIGMHSTDDMDDGYFGSGMLLWKLIKKHGKEKHVKEILEQCSSRSALKMREKEIVSVECLADPKCINLALGGEGGFISLEGCIKGGTSTAFRRSLSGEYDQHFRKTMSAALKNFLTSNPIEASNRSKRMTEAAKAAPAKEKRKDTFHKINHQSGATNSQFGTCWVTNGTPKKIKMELLKEYLLNGYSKGRKSSL